MSELSKIFSKNAAPAKQAAQGDYVYPHLLCPTKAEKDKLNAVVNKLAKTPLGRELLDCAAEYGTEIRLDNMYGIWGAFAYTEKKLRLNKDASEDRLVATLAHELRHSQQFQKGVEMDVLHDDPRSYLHSQCVIEADANVASCLVAWDLMKQGDNGVRDTLMQEDKGVFNKFFEVAQKEGTAKGSAPNAAFYEWFKDMRIRQAYENNYAKSVEYCKSRGSRKDPIFSRQVSVQDNIAKVCTVDGKAYVGKESEEFFKRRDLNEINYETFWSIYRAMRDAGRMDWSDANKQMNDYGFYQREQEFYSVKTPEKARESVEERQQRAANVIRGKKQQKTLPLSALVAQNRSRG